MAKGKKSPHKPKGSKKCDEDDVVYRKDADGNLYAGTVGPAKGKMTKKGANGKPSQASSSQGCSNSRHADNGIPGTSHQTPMDNPVNKPTKRMFLNKKPKVPVTDNNSSSDSSENSQSESDDESSSSAEDESESDAEEAQGSDDASSEEDGEDEESSDDGSDSDKDESEPTPKGKNKANGKNKNKKGKSKQKKKTVSTKAKKKGDKNKKRSKSSKGNPEKKNRKSKWTDQENYTLVHKVSPQYDLLHGKFKSGSGGREARDAGWRQVTGDYCYYLTGKCNLPKLGYVKNSRKRL